ncbi:hypothetical protein GWN26_14110, partial [Candidatus Saccharibacteria bacterium]|nr:hypothetical protein [Calditrichia bacterium]NIW00185.1 hypothetical protein [Candidatus Saccharibacteria bacterium]NIW80536.1 hypothetical protein [Calditrichia bacterium]
MAKLNMEKHPTDGQVLWLYRCLDNDGNEFARSFTTLQSLKHIDLPSPKIKLNIVKQTAQSIRLRIYSKTLTLAVQLDHPDLEFSANWLDIWPKEKREVTAHKLRDVKIKKNSL